MQLNTIDVQSLIKAMGDDYAEYLRDESRSSGSAQSISFAQTEAEVIALIREFSAQNAYITVQGGRTGISGGAVPCGGHVLNLSRMTAVRGLRQGSDGCFYVRVEPGLPLVNLREMLERKSLDSALFDAESKAAAELFSKAPEQFFSPDPTETTATLGGIAACNASGARSFLYGPARSYITALRVVLADGQTLALERGKVHARGRKLSLRTEQGTELEVPLPLYQMPKTKNASGYYIEDNLDAIDLFIGSDGTLGVITQIEIKLLPLPEFIWGANCFVENERQAIAFAEALRRQVDQVASIEYFDADALDILRRQKASGNAFGKLPDIAAEHTACVYCELHCTTEDAALERLSRIGDILLELGVDERSVWVAHTAAELKNLLLLRHAVPESVNMLIGERKRIDPVITKLGSDMSVPNDKLTEVIQMYRRTLDENGLETAVWGHIGDNHLHVNILPRSAAEHAAGKELFRTWAHTITEYGGAISAEHGVGKLKTGLLAIMYGEQAVREMAAVKAALDPQGLLGMGNMFPAELVR